MFNKVAIRAYANKSVGIEDEVAMNFLYSGNDFLQFKRFQYISIFV